MEMEDCFNRVLNPIALRNLKKSYCGKKLSDGKTIGVLNH